MHEWALAEAVIAAIVEVSDKEALKEVTEAKIRIGELQQIDQGILEFALSQLRPAKLEKTRFKIESARAILKCGACGHEWGFNKTRLDEETAEAIHFVPEVSHAYVRCPICGSPDFGILEGRGIWLENVKGVR
jgi:hydrogenase nickel incorporation protein HypA/HybF